MTRFAAVIVCAFSAAVAVAADSVATLRSGATVTIAEVSRAGALAASKATGVRRISLSAIRRVDGPLAGDFREHEELARTLWRAGVRLDRGDAPGAEPLYEAAWRLTEGAKGPTRAEAAAGLLACRVQRGAFASAVDVWATWLSDAPTLDAADAEKCRARLAAGDGVDSSSQWLTGMPPVFVDGPFVRAFAATEIESSESAGVADVRSIYRFAAKRDSAAPRSDVGSFENAKGWDNIAGDMVLGESSDPAVRERARKRLRERTGSDAPVWEVHWARLGLGRSLRLETDPAAKTDAVLELLWVASRESVAANVLAHALIAAAETLVELEDRTSALRVVSDLETRLPDHPIIVSARLSRLRADLQVGNANGAAGSVGGRPDGSTPNTGPAGETPKEDAK